METGRYSSKETEKHPENEPREPAPANSDSLKSMPVDNLLHDTINVHTLDVTDATTPRLVRFDVNHPTPKTATNEDILLSSSTLLERAAAIAAAIGEKRAAKLTAPVPPHLVIVPTTPIVSVPKASAPTTKATTISLDIAPATLDAYIPVPALTPTCPSPATAPHTPQTPSASDRPSSAKSVSFDTITNAIPTDYSYTARNRHPDYEFTRHSRTFLCGYDTHSYSQNALEWLLGELVEDGDEVVALRVVEESDDDHVIQAEETLQAIVAHNLAEENKKISMVLEYSIGKFETCLQRTIEMYEPSILIVGTKGRKMVGFKGLLPGSVSKYCLQHSPIPVIVVKPHQKRAKKKAKRLNDPSRKAYHDLLRKSLDPSSITVCNDGATGASPPMIPQAWMPEESMTGRLERLGGRTRSM